MTKLVLERAWAWELPRLPDGLDTVVLTDDPAVVYVLGNIGSNGVLRAVDPRTGERIRDAWMPVFVRSYSGVVVSRPSPDKTVVVAIATDDKATLLEVNLAGGTYRYVATFPWHPWQIERLDDGRLLIDGGVLLDPKAPREALDGLRRWRSRDLRHEIREEPAEARTYPRVRLHCYADGVPR